MKLLITGSVGALAWLLSTSLALANINISESEVKLAQERWGDGIVRIGKVMSNGGNYVQEAFDHIEAMYDYDDGTVLFKPTLASSVPHRPTVGGALSYFVGYDSATQYLKGLSRDERRGLEIFEEDNGFATNPWRQVRFDNHDIVFHGPTAVAMGNYYFTDMEGRETKVHYTLGFIKRGDEVRIYVQESNLPFNPDG